LRSLVTFIVLVFALNSLLLSYANAKTFASINSTLPKDVLVICTGSSVKYISESALYENGLIVEIELDDGEQSQLAKSDITQSCPLNLGLDKGQLHQLYSCNQIQIRLAFQFTADAQQNASLCFNEYSLAITRAPPLLA
jgi:hypothetical protein